MQRGRQDPDCSHLYFPGIQEPPQFSDYYTTIPSSLVEALAFWFLAFCFFRHKLVGGEGGGGVTVRPSQSQSSQGLQLSSMSWEIVRNREKSWEIVRKNACEGSATCSWTLRSGVSIFFLQWGYSGPTSCLDYTDTLPKAPPHPPPGLLLLLILRGSSLQYELRLLILLAAPREGKEGSLAHGEQVSSSWQGCTGSPSFCAIIRPKNKNTEPIDIH